MWKQLKKVHERSNLSSKMYLRKKLYKMRLQDDQNMQEYISAILRLVEQLRGVGEEVSDQQVATLLLCGLPDEYCGAHQMLVAQSNFEPPPQTFAIRTC